MLRNGLSFLGLTFLTLGATLYPAIPSESPSVVAVLSANRSLSLIGFIPAWNNTSANRNPTITIHYGDSVTLALSSGDGAPHLFFVDVDRSGSNPNCSVDKCSSLFPPSTTYAFTVDFPTGSYKYYCSVHPITMLGIFMAFGGGGPGGGRFPDRMA